MDEMNNKMIAETIQRHLDCLQHLDKADELSASGLEFMVHRAWEIENYARCLLNREREEDKN